MSTVAERSQTDEGGDMAQALGPPGPCPRDHWQFHPACTWREVQLTYTPIGGARFWGTAASNHPDTRQAVCQPSSWALYIPGFILSLHSPSKKRHF